MKIPCCLLVVALAAPALAQDFQNFKPAPGTRNYFTIERAEPTPAWDFVPSVYFNYSKNPLVRRDEDGNITEEIVSDLLSFNALGAFGFPYDLELGVDVPLGHASGTDINTLGDGGFALGDVRVIPKWRLSPADEAGGVAIVVPLVLPTATGAEGQGTSSILVEPKLVAGVTFPMFSLAANVGFRYRPSAEEVEDLSFGSEVTYGGGVGIPLGTPRWVALAELFGSVPVLAAKGASEPLEGHFGLRWFAPLGPVFTLGGGRGFVAGRGSPDYRVSLGIAWDPRSFDEPPPPPPPPPAAPPPPPDSDGDGLLDPDDACPQEAEDKDDFEDADGCPDPDNDKDGILDAPDKCPLEAEDKDTFEDADGCPDPDNDKDEILDAADKCPLKAEDKDGFQDTDGCPDPDNDQDGFPDANDKCPNKAEVYNEFEDDDGCPDKGQAAKIIVTKQKVEILEKVYFDLNKATIKRKSYSVLNQVAAVLKANPDIKMMRVEGHTDRHGTAKHNMWLSKWRAKAVARYLTIRGVKKERLVSEGYGFTRPLKPEETDEADAVNRRVEFVIVDRKDEDAPPP